MKHLYMARHAKSSWKHDLPDHQRPLKQRGHSDATLVSQQIASELAPPDVIISSDANRASSTAESFRKAFGLSQDSLVLDHSLYDFSGQDVMHIIKTLDDRFNTVMIVGHNHAFTSVANMLGSSYIDNLPTSGFVKISFPVESWKDVTTGQTDKMLFPRHLKTAN
jgi:phosphohistidine phosphatase